MADKPDSSIRRSVDGTGPDKELTRQIETAKRNPNLNLGRAVLLEELGRGGMGVVYKAWQEDLHRMVAIKVLPAHASEQSAQRFLREARLVSKLRHPNIVAVHEMGEHRGAPWFAMDLVEGGSLDPLMRNRKMPVKRLMGVLRDMALALDYAHGQGVVHRDLKPANILMGADGTPFLTDFGLAGMVDGGGDRLTMTGAIMGTPQYMSPEQARGRTAAKLDHRTDIYSLGAMMYEGLTGRPVVARGEIIDMVQRVVNEEPEAPSKLAPGVSREAETICMKCLRKDPAERYATAKDLADDIDRFLEGAPIAARGASPLAGVSRGVARNRATILAVAAVALVGVIVLTVLVRRNSANEQAARKRDVVAERDRDAAATRELELKAIVEDLKKKLEAETDPEKRKAIAEALLKASGTGTPIETAVKPDPPVKPVIPPPESRTLDLDRRIVALLDLHKFGEAAGIVSGFAAETAEERTWRDAATGRIDLAARDWIDAIASRAGMAMAADCVDDAVAAWKEAQASDLESHRAQATAAIAEIESKRTTASREMELPLLDLARERVVAACADRRRYADALKEIGRLEQETRFLGPEIAILRSLVERAASVPGSALKGAAASKGKKVDLKTGPAEIVETSGDKIQYRDVATKAQLTSEIGTLDATLMVSLAETGGASPESIGAFWLFEGKPEEASKAWAKSAEKQVLDQEAASIARLSAERDAQKALEELFAAAERKDMKKVREILSKRERYAGSPAWGAVAERISEIEFTASEKKDELFAVATRGNAAISEWRYDFSAPEGLMDWPLDDSRVYSTPDTHGVGIEAGFVRLHEGGLRWKAPLDGEVRMAMELTLRETANKWNIQLRIGGLHWQISGLGEQFLRGFDGTILDEKNDALLPLNRTVKLELVVSRAGIRCVQDGKEVLKSTESLRGWPSPPTIGSVGTVSIDITRISVAGHLPADWAAEERRRAELLRRAGKVAPFDKPIVLSDGKSLGILTTAEQGTWTPGPEGLQGSSPDDGTHAELHWWDDTRLMRNFRFRMSYQIQSGRCCEVGLRQGTGQLAFLLPSDKPGVWRTVEVVAVEDAVSCVVDGRIPVAASGLDAPPFPGGFRINLQTTRATLKDLTLEMLQRIPPHAAWSILYQFEPTSKTRVTGDFQAKDRALTGKKGGVEFDAPAAKHEVLFTLEGDSAGTIVLEAQGAVVLNRIHDGSRCSMMLRARGDTADVLVNGVEVAKGVKLGKAGPVRLNFEGKAPATQFRVLRILTRP